LLLFLQHTEVCKYFRVVTQCLQELQTLIILVTYLLGHHHERYLQVQKCISARTEAQIGTSPNWDWGKKKTDLSDKNTRAILLANAASFIFQHKAQSCSTGEANLPVSTGSICYPF
jgi:hypothetical protein